ncbi:Lipid phosphate phosphatase 2 [Zea mays]|uniref:Lipid phosphate phosphatase 2 n=1 Tax=Zea mays TaxID=4577 RepID=A0A1D6MBS7_MAIZE|nr:Lipid phosphate phosphatase 2 [Zea mays]
MPAAPAIRLGPPHPYLKTHGGKVARLHRLDWAVLLLIAAADVGLNLVEPFHRFVGEDMLADLRYPLKSNTVPVWAVPVYAVIGPIVVFVGLYLKRRNVYDMHHAILGKLPKYDNITRGVLCDGVASVIKEGHKSFPSGHSSWSFAGLGFLSWYLAGKVKAFDRRGHVAKLCVVLLPLLLAAMVAVSRVDDYWHHWQDVFAGGILGRHFPDTSSFNCLTCTPSAYRLSSLLQGWWLRLSATFSFSHRHLVNKLRRFWPHAYSEHILNPEREGQAQSTASSNHHRRLSSRGHVAVEMSTATASQEASSLGPMEEMEEGRGAR